MPELACDAGQVHGIGHGWGAGRLFCGEGAELGAEVQYLRLGGLTALAFSRQYCFWAHTKGKKLAGSKHP
ncbi:hypothetical protein GCM10027345_40510 [Hymenobacter daeguensis]